MQFRIISCLRYLVLFCMIAALFFNSAGYLLLFYNAKHTLQKEIKMRLKKSVPMEELHAITFFTGDKTAQAMIWLKHNEFRLHGNMYDVVYTTNNADGSITYQCINDHEETVLFANLSSLIAGELQHGASPQAKRLKLLEKLSSDYIVESSTKQPPDAAFVLGFINSIIRYSAPERQVFIPPPSYS